MGADGHWHLMRRDEFVAQFPDVRPEDCGISQVTVLGVEALAAYEDTEGRHDLFEPPLLAQQRWLTRFVANETLAEVLAAIGADPDLPRQRRIAAVQKWFFTHAEDHTVWT